MFKGTKDIMLKTSKPMADVIKAIEDCSNYIGNVNVSESGNISTNATRFEGFGYDPEISGFVVDKGEGKFFISIQFFILLIAFIGVWMGPVNILICIFLSAILGLTIWIVKYFRNIRVEKIPFG